MSGTPWWKKEVSLRRPRGTVVVAKPVAPADLVERAAALFEELETDLNRTTLHAYLPTPTPAPPAEPVVPSEPAGAGPPALPAVWPQALVDPAPVFYVPTPVEVTPTVEPEPEFFARPSVPEAEYFLEPVPAPLPLDEAPETFWPPVSSFPFDDHSEVETFGVAAFDDTARFDDTAHFDDTAPYDPDPFEPVSFEAPFEPVSFEPEPEPEVQTPSLDWHPFVPEEPVAEVEPEPVLEVEAEVELVPAAEATPAPREIEPEP